MVLFIDIIRKFSFRHFSQYINELAKGIVKEFVKGLPDAVDDDLRGLAAQVNERIGHADNLTQGSLLARSQTGKVIHEGSGPPDSALALWLYMNDVNSANQKDMSGWTGFIDKWLTFDGVNDYVDLTNDATLWSQSLTKFSFSIWFYPTQTSGFIATHGEGANHGIICYISGASTISFRIRNSVGTPFDAISTGQYTLNQWNHVVCVYDNSLGSQNLKVYVNGVLGATTANLTEAINNSSAFTLSDVSSGTHFKGREKDFRWWTTTALSAAQALALYKRSPIPTPNYWLKTREGTGNPVDAISGTKVGTLTSGASWTVVDYTKTIESIGNPCVVKTNQNFIARKEVGYFDGVSDGLRVVDHTDIQLPNNPNGISIGYWLYVPTGGDAIKPIFYDPWSIKLDGVNDFIQCGSDTIWNTSLTKFSFACWVYSSVAPAGADKYIISHGNASNQGIRLFYLLSNQKISFNLKDSLGNNVNAVSDNALPLNTWTHIVCTYDNALGSDNLKLYINGVLQADKGNLTETLSLTDELTIGTEINANTPDIYVKEFKFWKPEVLTAAQADAEYRGFKWNNDIFPDYYLPMWEAGVGNPVDAVSGSKEGVLTNGAAWNNIIFPPYAEQMAPIIYRKMDVGDSQINIFLDPTSKRLLAQVFDAGAVFLRKVDNAYTYDTWVFHVLEFEPATNTFTIYKDGVSQSITNGDTWINFDPDVPDAYIANSGIMFADPLSPAYSNIALYNFKFWKRKLTAIEVYNESVNKFSISNITAAERPIVGYMSLTNIDSDNPFAGTPIGPVIRKTGVWSGNDNTIGDGLWSGDVVSVGTDTDVNDTTEGLGQQFATAASGGSNAGLRQSNDYYRREWTSYMIARIKPSSNSNIGMFIGFTSQNADFVNTTILDNLSGVGVGKRASDTNLQLIRNDGDATTDYVDTGIPFPNNTAVTIEIMLNATDFRAVIGGVLQTPQTTELPALTTQLMAQLEIETSDAVAKNLQIFAIFSKIGT